MFMVFPRSIYEDNTEVQLKEPKINITPLCPQNSKQWRHLGRRLLQRITGVKPLVTCSPEGDVPLVLAKEMSPHAAVCGVDPHQA